MHVTAQLKSAAASTNTSIEICPSLVSPHNQTVPPCGLIYLRCKKQVSSTGEDAMRYDVHQLCMAKSVEFKHKITIKAAKTLKSKKDIPPS